MADILSRQQEAQSVASKRQTLRSAQILRKNQQLADALGLRHEFKKGDKVWQYRKPITHTDRITGVEARLSRKLLNHWVGPYEVVLVGPNYAAGEEKVRENVLLLKVEGALKRVSVHQVKNCRDPAVLDDRPDSLPDGFARYLLTRPSANILPPKGLTDDEVTWESDRHGVDAIVAHRVLIAARGRQSQLQYRVRWEGPNSVDSWEPESNLDACPEAIDEYWTVVDASREVVRDGNTKVVKGYLNRARMKTKGQQPLRCGVGMYKLPPNTYIIPTAPARHFYKSAQMEGMRLAMTWTFDKGESTERVEWVEGIIKKVDQAQLKRKSSKPYIIRFFDDNQDTAAELPTTAYNTDPKAGEGAWFLFGDEASMARTNITSGDEALRAPR